MLSELVRGRQFSFIPPRILEWDFRSGCAISWPSLLYFLLLGVWYIEQNIIGSSLRHDDIWTVTWEIFAYAKTKAQISCAVTAQLISAFVFATREVQFLFFLIPKFQASSHRL